MAGLDSEGSPFNSNARDHIQSFQRSFNKSNGFSGDISSNGKMNGNIRPKPYLSNSHLRDPVMNDSQDSQNQSGYINDSHDEAQKRRDELYEKILRDTSNAFNRMGEQNVTLNVTADASGTHVDSTQDESGLNLDKSPGKGQRSKIPRASGAKRGTDSDTDYDRSMASEKYDSLKGPGGEIIMSLSPFDDDGKKEDEIPERGGQASRVSDFSYGMDSFEQSYVSERGEVVHLGDEMDYPESPSPIRQDSDNDDF